MIEQRCLQDLGDSERPFDDRQRYVSVGDPPFRHRLEAQGIPAHAAQPLDEIIREEAMSLDPMSPEGVSLLGSEAGTIGPSPQPAPARIDGVPRLVLAVIGVTPEEVLEPGVAFMSPCLK